MYPSSSKLPSHPGLHINTEQGSLCPAADLVVIHFKYSSVYMTIPAPQLSFPLIFPPGNHKSIL